MNMARLNFGNTWWGEKWLGALADIDFDNRLPRGRSYARNGSVLKVNINGNKIKAKVEGRWDPYYNISIVVPAFSRKEKKAIIKAVTENKFYLSKLLNRELPGELYGDLASKGIKIFPSKWKDLKLDCSCPDWAVPCKHIAAVVYIIANEIDKNPFLVFNLHNFDILKELESEEYSICQAEKDGIKPIGDFIKEGGNEEDFTLNYKKIDELDFSAVPAMKDHLLSLLSPKPLFSPGKDFKVTLSKAYRNLTRNVSIFAQEEAGSDLEKAAEENVEINLIVDRELNFKEADIKTKSDAGKRPAADFFQIISFLNNLPAGKIQNYSDKIISFYFTYHFTLKLLAQGAFVPQLVRINKENYKIKWAPALLDEKIKRIFERLAEIIPPEAIKVELEKKRGRKNASGKTKNKRNKKRMVHLARKERALILTSFFLETLIEKFADLNENESADFIPRLFFNGEILKANAFETKELPQTINLWLGKLHLAHKNFAPLLKIEEDKNDFALNVLIENKKDQLKEPLPLEAVLNDKKYNRIKVAALKDLALLSDQFPAVKKIISSEGRENIRFSSRQFAQVFFEALPAVKLLGINILLPRELENLIKPKLTLSLEKNSGAGAVKSYLSFGDLFNFNWKIAIGDKFLSPKEFMKLARESKGIIKIKDQFVYLDEKDINKILKRLDDQPNLSSNEITKTVLAGKYEGAEIDLSKEAMKTVRSLFKKQAIEIPPGLNADLRKYQKSGYHWLYKNAKAGFGSLIADDMGLGKTIQVIAVLLRLKKEGLLKSGPGLVIAPATLLTNWQREVEKFAPRLKTSIYHGQQRKLDGKKCDLVITTYGLARSENDLLKSKKWPFVIIDEAQNIKNPNTSQSKAVKNLKSKIKIAMTGTPVENRLSEYWSIFDFLNKGYLGNLNHFKNEFAIPIELYRNKEKLELFRKITQPFILRRVKTDKSVISDLPKKMEINKHCSLTKEQAALYQNVMDKIMKQVEQNEGIERRGLIFKMIVALKQICNHPAHFLKKKEIDPELSGKTALLLNLLRNIYESGEKALIFTQYKEMGDLLIKMMEEEFKREVLFLHGGVSRKKRDEMVDRFQEERNLPVMILSLKAGGTGLNLTAAANVIHFDLWWNPAVEAQATDRAFRIGQKKNVMVYRLVTQGTFEEKIDQIIKDKKELADLAVAKGERWIGELSNKELKEVFKLS